MLMVAGSSEEYLLKCSTCNKPLSVAPIYHNDSTGSICGRCAQNGLIDSDKDVSWVRQVVVEKIGSYLLFPCSYQVFGCNIKLRWDSVLEHENTCPYSDIVCPLSHKYFNNRCSWIGEHDHLTKHIKEKHKNLFCAPPTLKVTEKLENSLLFCEIAGHLIIIMLITDEELNRYLCYIFGEFPLEDCNLYQCQVDVSTNELARPSKIANVDMQPLTRDYLKKFDSGVEIDVNDYMNNGCSTTKDLFLSFNILKEDKSQETDEFDQKILQELECPVCYEYIQPPIFICQAGHNICEMCSNKIDCCPICRQNLLGGRNFTLETLAAKVHFPCVNKYLGCTYVAMLPDIKNHQQNCQYVARECFLDNCPWRGINTSFKDHLKEKHLNSLLETYSTQVHHMNIKNQDYIMILDDDIFVLKFSTDNKEYFKYAVLHFERETTNYKYKLKLKDPSFDIGITVSNRCQPVPAAVNIVQYNDNFTSIPIRFLSQFLLNFHQIEFMLDIE